MAARKQNEPRAGGCMTILSSNTTGTAKTGGRWWAFNGLGLYVLLMYGITYYALTTAAPRMATDFAIPVSAIFGLFSAALLATAFLAPRYGRWTDHFGAARVLLAGALLRAVALALMALAPDVWWFAAAFILVQLLSQVTEYDATFAAAVQIGGSDARIGMSHITLWGGLASTAFWPATAFLLDHVSWQTMLLIYAAIMLAVCVPIAALLNTIPHVARDSVPDNVATPAPTPIPEPAQRFDTRFVLLAAAFAFGGIAANLPALMLPVLGGLGLGTTAIIVGMLFGPSQTIGRLFEMLFGQRLHPLGVAVIASAMVAVSLVILLIDGSAWSSLLFAVVFGAGLGVSYVVRGSVVLALYGTEQYGTWLGRLGSVRLVISALSPLLLALILERQGAWSVVAFCALAAVISLGFFVLLERSRRTPGPT